MDSVSTVWSISAWLRDASTYLVSRFDFLCLIDLYSFDLNPAALTPRSIDPIATFRQEFGWLRGPGTSMVSRFTLLRWFLIDTLDLDLYRFDLHAAVSTSPSNESNDSIGPFRCISAWLRATHTFEVSRFDFMCLADFFSFDFESSASTSMHNDSIQTFCVSDGWPG